MTAAQAGPNVVVEGHEVQRLDEGWTVRSETLGPLPAAVPGTAAGALRTSGLWSEGDPRDFDADDWWFTTSFAAEPAREDEEVLLAFDGIATVATVSLNGEPVTDSSSMFEAHTVDVGSLLRGQNELTIRCHGLRPLLAERRRPRARWRTRIAEDGNLRFFRTMLLGRMPGVASGPAAVGPWRPVTLERRSGLVVDRLALRPCLDGRNGVLEVSAGIRPLDGRPLKRAAIEVDGPTGRHVGEVYVEDGLASGQVVVPDVACWWPHTHGEAALYHVTLTVNDVAVDCGRVGFRTIESPRTPEVEGLDLHVNGVPVFVRGAVWTPVDIVGLAPPVEDIRSTIHRAREAGMNMLRIPGIAAYECDDFHAICDEAGMLVWQDFMFANFDYPFADEGFHELVRREAHAVLERRRANPSLAVLCGGSEVEQQASMLGLDPTLARSPFYREELPALTRELRVEAPYVPSAPCGGDLPFRPGSGIANYFGVGAYRRPLEDARLARVRFAAECLAFANVPNEEAVETMFPRSAGRPAVHHPRWKAGVPRDNGAGWDFDDVRDHYLRLVFGVDPSALRTVDAHRYLELSRALSGEIMAEAFGEWRRAGSPTRGALVLWLRDVVPGAGWGIIDSFGQPKVAWHHLRRVLAPVAVWTTDEGLAGVDVHVANDGPDVLEARLRVSLYGNLEHVRDEVETELRLPGHETATYGLEQLLGRFVDASWAYRFGPPPHDAIVASLEREGALLSQAVRFPAGRPLALETADELGLTAATRVEAADCVSVTVASRRLAYGVRLHAPGWAPEDDAFTLEPGHERTVLLHSVGEPDPGTVVVTALNLDGRLTAAVEGVPA